MPSYLQVERLSKSYGPKVLFENISFNVNEGDKIALIAPNGTGKTSLMKILAGKDSSDRGGSVLFLKDIKIAFLEQEFDYDLNQSIEQQIFEGEDFDFQLRARKILDEFSLKPSQMMGELSGGEVKRVALTQLLARDADFLIMDEPTNHLDLDAIEYLESFLKRSRCTLFVVSHDRYFLDRVCNTIMELDHGSIYIYKGDYENFLQKREERMTNYNAETERVRNVLRRELEWMHATPCARSGKAKYRKQAFYELKERSEAVYTQRQISLSELSKGSRVGSKIINCKNLSFYYDNQCYLKDFTYNFQRYERLGIVGGNGVGKSTFLGLLTGEDTGTGTLSGSIEWGESLNIGYYRQSGMSFDEDDTVLETVPDTHLLGQFLFPHDMLSTRISKLSGGERRRLYLLTILMKKPNLLILDEPTNDLDIVTLNILEEYLLDFKGTLIIVSHDRHFLDRLVDHIFVFCGDGLVKDFIGGYTEYRTFLQDFKSSMKANSHASSSFSSVPAAPAASAPAEKKKLSYKEKREFETLEKELEDLNARKSELEKILSGEIPASTEALIIASESYQSLKEELDLKELRWLELAELA
ncbi:MAG: ABC-F family ATP-binding cassette domain-containing protein [Candidatus Cryptobacteroides sp.]